MTDQQRIEHVIKHAKVSAKKFAENIGLTRPDRVYFVLRGRNNISSALAKLITDAYPEISYDWLISDKGKMILTEYEQNETIETIPFVSKDELLQFSENCVKKDYIQSLPTIQLPNLDKSLGYIAFEAYDDSMFTNGRFSLNEGDIAITIQSNFDNILKEESSENYYVIFTFGFRPLIRKLSKIDNEQNCIIFEPSLKLFAPIRLYKNDIFLIFKVVATIIKQDSKLSERAKTLDNIKDFDIQWNDE